MIVCSTTLRYSVSGFPHSNWKQNHSSLEILSSSIKSNLVFFMTVKTCNNFTLTMSGLTGMINEYLHISLLGCNNSMYMAHCWVFKYGDTFYQVTPQCISLHITRFVNCQLWAYKTKFHVKFIQKFRPITTQNHVWSSRSTKHVTNTLQAWFSQPTWMWWLKTPQKATDFAYA